MQGYHDELYQILCLCDHCIICYTIKVFTTCEQFCPLLYVRSDHHLQGNNLRCSATSCQGLSLANAKSVTQILNLGQRLHGMGCCALRIREVQRARRVWVRLLCQWWE